MLDIKIYTFLTVVETGSYTAAAKKLHVTQPAVTQHIQKLEEYYHCRLFAKEGRAMMLTPQGESFLHYVHMQESNEKQLLEKLSDTSKPLRIGSTLSIGDYYLPERLVPFMGQQDISFQISVANTEILLHGLIHGKLDGAFIEGIFDRTLFEAEIFLRANFIPVVAKDHPLAEQKISLSQLYEYPLILREEGSGTRAIFESYLAQQNDSVASFSQIWEISSFVLIKHLLAHSQGISFMYEAVAEAEIAQGKLATLEIEAYGVIHPLQFVYLKNSLKQEEIRRFYEHCLEVGETSKN